ncbi:S41 family peptidase [Marinimicrobium sp. ABcell2]|uniref:S41 family peptidase n=1 Tax=Marinimicrobium sp. ABcell2 TaxID=3069751 RepID=UPI0027B623C1|nr:S41 family peptidase [Marinimicrobium sp. ABcell2]MDQ2077280.1 S41 family peptidase [Marinimicrobium sp. ABcell2]
MKTSLFTLMALISTTFSVANASDQQVTEIALVVSNCQLEQGAVLVDCISSDWRFPSYFEMPLDGSPGREVLATEDYHHFIQARLIQDSQSDRDTVLDVRYSDKPANALFRSAPSELQGYPADMRAFRSGHLEFDIKVLDWGKASDIAISIECGWPCSTSHIPLHIDEVGTWKSFAFSAQELVNKGLNLSRLSSAVNFIPTWDNQQGIHYQLANLRWVTGEIDNSLPYAPPDYWSNVATQDLDFIYQLARDNHPGAIDEQNPAFREYMETGYQTARAMAEAAKTEADYQTAISYYMAGFADEHFYVSFTGLSFEPPLWPGMDINMLGSQYLVNTVTPSGWPVALPEPGSELISCDGREVEALIDEDVLHYRFRDNSVRAARARYAPELFRVGGLGNRTPYKECVFAHQGRKTTYQMHWSAAPSGASNSARAQHREAYPASAMIEEIESGVYWVYLPTFLIDSEDDVAEFEQILAALKNLPEPRTLVMDVRFNGGGSSRWAFDILRSLYGSMSMVNLSLEAGGQYHYSEFRLSDQNLQYAKHHLARINPSTANAIARSGRQGKTWHTEQNSFGFAGRLAGFFGRLFSLSSDTQIVFLTSHSCASACLDFADMVRLLPNATHLGEETGVDSLYIDVNLDYPAILPSNLGQVIYPMKVWRKRFRDHNESYVPDILYDGDIFDTETVKEWVLTVI